MIKDINTSETSETPNFDKSDPAISIKELKKSFGTRIILDGINIDIQKGENVAVLGKSGTGKSVLIKIISGLLKPDIAKVEIPTETEKRCKKAGYLLWQFSCFNLFQFFLSFAMLIMPISD